jgi:hypothetical protein
MMAAGGRDEGMHCRVDSEAFSRIVGDQIYIHNGHLMFGYRFPSTILIKNCRMGSGIGSALTLWHNKFPII